MGASIAVCMIRYVRRLESENASRSPDPCDAKSPAGHKRKRAANDARSRKLGSGSLLQRQEIAG